MESSKTLVNRPLADRIRPQKLDQIVGQTHLIGPNGPLRRFIESKKIPSMIFWGPPGTGKTTLAGIIAKEAGIPFKMTNAIQSGVKELRQIIEEGREVGGLILFIDEIHRFNKSQQDSLLAGVEEGSVILIGATTENPSFEINAALLSRARVFILENLSEDDLIALLKRALNEDAALRDIKVELHETDALLRLSGGDGRILLNLLELVISALPKDGGIITNELVWASAQKKMPLYDKSGEQHYNIISAFIKSMRGSDPNAALYWMTRMIEAGEDPLFIARRMVIFSSEDIGNANPNALLLATATFQAVQQIGLPEAAINLSHCVTYLASSVKSNASYVALKKAQSTVRQTGDLPVPLHLRNAPTKLMKNLEYGKHYQYDHDSNQRFSGQEFLPSGLEGTNFYKPGESAREQELRAFLKSLWKNKYNF